MKANSKVKKNKKLRMLSDEGLSEEEGSKQKVYLPSPEKIAEEARKIREEWTKDDIEKRSGVSKEPYVIPTAFTMLQTEPE
tara:strand:+ start:13496 stop:13738 length:243 start_codon:yes stop_codon:yes gene_type:complete